eukprot:388232-Pleurochrysis_carterae.AAC.2
MQRATRVPARACTCAHRDARQHGRHGGHDERPGDQRAERVGQPPLAAAQQHARRDRGARAHRVGKHMQKHRAQVVAAAVAARVHLATAAAEVVPACRAQPCQRVPIAERNDAYSAPFRNERAS